MHDVFELRRGWYKSRPIVEILKNGTPFWEELPESKDHFSFGYKKAVLLLSCFDTIKAFHDSCGKEPPPGRVETIGHSGFAGRVEIRRFEGFKSRGAWVNRPYLEIATEGSRIGLGMMKAKALLELQGEIQQFVNWVTEE